MNNKPAAVIQDDMEIGFVLFIVLEQLWAMKKISNP